MKCRPNIVHERVELQAQPIPGDPNNSITLQTRARDKKFLPQDGANVTITVRFVPSGSTNTNGVSGSSCG